MTDHPANAPDDPATAALAPPAAALAKVATEPAPAAPIRTMLSGNAWIVGAAAVGAISVVSLTLVLLSQQRIKTLEQELVRRQQDSQSQVIESHAMAKQAQEVAHASEAKLALLEGRVAETALQRTQLEDLIQQLSRSRDENVLADIDSAIRVSVQQSAITGSAEPMTAALRQAEERLSRLSQPRLERVRRALARDIDRVRAVSVTDIASLTIKLDEAVRLVDELPMLSQPERRAGISTPPGVQTAPSAAVRAAGSAAPTVASTASAARPNDGLTGAPNAWLQWLRDGWRDASERVWAEVRSLVRVTRIDSPEAMLIAPEQAWFLRENLKLRLLNARLALLSRQFDIVQSDLRDAQSALDRYFDRSSRRVVVSADLVRQVSAQARLVALPRPDETLSAIVAVQSGR